MPRKTKTSEKAPDLKSREAAWNESLRMLAIEHKAFVAEAELQSELLSNIKISAAQIGIDLQAITDRRASAYKKLVADLQALFPKVSDDVRKKK
jgi:hypothetical protein